ncbi:MAG TPA: hypothetical protein VM261_32085, partial [Kofleriaceae bacterium]|nr:hypothetical protein [Kofleriaceae bacterium]
MELRFEWFVAWRHLYERHPRAGRIAHVFSAFAFTVAAIALALMLRTKPLGPVQIIAGHRDWRQIFHVVVVVALELAVLTLVFGWFRRRLSMFSTISAYGVFLG